MIDNYSDEKKKADKLAAELKMQHVRLQQLTEEKGKLFSIVFRDFKSPLGSVQLYLQAIVNSGIVIEYDQRIRDNLLQLTKDTPLVPERVLIWISQQLGDKPLNLQRVDATDATYCSRQCHQILARQPSHHNTYPP